MKAIPAADSPETRIATSRSSPAVDSSLLVQLEEYEKKPRRPPPVHWGAFVLSLASFLLLVIWLVGSETSVPTFWLWADIGTCAFFIFEFFTRSGFKWNPAGYLVTHIFDFIAVIPALLLANNGVEFQGIWVWLIVAARFVRTVDRLLGDGFVRRNTLALTEGFEEEITDRVMLRIMSRIQVDLESGNLANVLAGVLERNKEPVLARIRSKYAQKGIVKDLAHVMKIDLALERVESLVYNAIVDIIRSAEAGDAIRDTIASAFVTLKAEIGTKRWRKHLGFKS